MTAHPIRFGIASGQQTYQWRQLKELWETADQLGYDSLWTSDHLYAILVDPTESAFEGWTTLAALSQHTGKARIGALVNCNGFRNPCLTAKMAATLDHASGGRFILGLGAGWFELEHKSFGFDFKPVPERLQALDEALRIIKAMLSEGKTTFHGRHYHVTDALCSPRPIQAPRPSIEVRAPEVRVPDARARESGTKANPAPAGTPPNVSSLAMYSRIVFAAALVESLAVNTRSWDRVVSVSRNAAYASRSAAFRGPGF